MSRSRHALLVLATIAIIVAAVAAPPLDAAPEGQMTWAVHISLAPIWFEPAETSGMITPFMVLYALHDAMVKPMPGNGAAPSLAESWTAAPDGLSYEFVLRKGVTFHNGDPMTAEDVKFSFERYRGVAAGQLKSHVAGVDVLDPLRVRFRLKQPWPDFMAFYGTPATGAGWIVPKKYVEKVGDEGFKYSNIAETVINDFRTVGIRTRLRPLERAAFFKEYAEKKLRNIVQGSSGAYGNAATRIDAFVAAGGAYVYGSYPDIESLVRDQGNILDRKKREQVLHRVQQLLHDKVVYAPIWELALLNGQGGRVAEAGLGLIPNHAYSAPYEDVRLKKP